MLQDALETPGGAPVQMQFTATAPYPAARVTLRLGPISDVNSNARIEEEATSPMREKPYPQNSVKLRDSSGKLLATTYVSGALIAHIAPGHGNKLTVTVEPGSWLLQTSATLFRVPTNRLIIRPAGVSSGTIVPAPDSDLDRRPIVSLYFRARMEAITDLLELALQKDPMELELQGRLAITPDGRMRIEMKNMNTARLSSALGLVKMQLLPGDIRLTVEGRPGEPL